MAIEIVPMTGQKSQDERLKEMAAAKIGVDRSKRLRDLMEKITYQKRLPGSNLEGASRVFTGLLSAYHGGQESDQNKKLQEQLLESLKGRSEVDRMRAAMGDVQGALSSISAGDRSTAAADVGHQRALELLREREKARRATAASDRASSFEQAKQLLEMKNRAKEEQQRREYETLYGKTAPGNAAPGSSSVTAPIPEGAPAVPSSTPGVDVRSSTQDAGSGMRPSMAPFATEPSGLTDMKELAKKRAAKLAEFEAKHPEKAAKAYDAYQSWKNKFETSKTALTDIAKEFAGGDKGAAAYIPDAATGQLAQIQKWLPVTTTKFANVRANLDTVLGATAITELQKMREASPTGGAVGNVSDKDMELLKAQRGALNQSMGTEAFVRNLSRYMETLEKLNRQVEDTYSARWGAPPKEERERGSAAPAAPASGAKRLRFDPESGNMVPVE